MESKLASKCSTDSTHRGQDIYQKLTRGRLRQCENEQKILGVRWNFMHDELIFDLSELAILISNTQPTKRHIVGIAMKFYDHIGFVSPVIIRFKMLFQELCTCKIG